MKVILIADVKDVGQKGDEKEVKPGFARNFLLPRSLAVPAESAEGREIIAEVGAAEEKKESQNKKIEEILASHQNLEVKYKRKARGKKLFGGIKPAEIISSIEKIVGIKPLKIKPATAIKEIGSYKVDAEFAVGQDLTVTVVIKAEK